MNNHLDSKREEEVNLKENVHYPKNILLVTPLLIITTIIFSLIVKNLKKNAKKLKELVLLDQSKTNRPRNSKNYSTFLFEYPHDYTLGNAFKSAIKLLFTVGK